MQQAINIAPIFEQEITQALPVNPSLARRWSTPGREQESHWMKWEEASEYHANNTKTTMVSYTHYDGHDETLKQTKWPQNKPQCSEMHRNTLPDFTTIHQND